MHSAKNFFSAEQVKAIESAIKSAEENSSGEIRVHIENRCKGDELLCATKTFHKLGMHKTDLRNGVLFYLAVKDKRFAIIGDGGINAKTGPHFWDEIKAMMEGHFRKGEFAIGLENGVRLAGDALKKHFPYKKDDKNELSDDIVFGKS